MERKRSTGITLASLISIIFFGYSLLFFIFLFPPLESLWFIRLKFIICAIISLFGLIASIYVFDTRHWARKLILYSCLFFLGLGIVTDISQLIILKWSGVPYFVTFKAITLSFRKIVLYAFWGIVIGFLTRPKVKEQFK